MLEVNNKRVTVIGLGKRTGVATAKMLSTYGALVTVSDIKGAEDLQDEMALLNGYQIEYDLNGHSEKSLESDLIVVSPGVPLDTPFFREAARREIPVISEIELAYQFTQARIIAITGTNGKTTTTSILGKILQAGYAGQVKVGGNIGTPLIQEVINLTADDLIVAEISSFQLETIKDFRPAISIYLNFTPDHLDRHRSVENYWQAKKKIFVNQTDEDIALINFDDREVVRAVENCPAQIFGVTLTDSPVRGAYLKGNKIFINISEQVEEIIDLEEIPLRGPHNVQNVAFAVLTARLLGIDKKVIVREIKNFTAAEHRLEELVHCDNGTIIIDDSKATNPDAAVKALQAFDQPIILIAGGQDRDADFSEMADLISKKVKAVVLLGETKDKLSTAVLKTGFTNIHIVEEMDEAVNVALKLLQPGDCLLLSPGCPSWDMYSSYKERGNDFRVQISRQSPSMNVKNTLS